MEKEIPMTNLNNKNKTGNNKNNTSTIVNKNNEKIKII